MLGYKPAQKKVSKVIAVSAPTMGIDDLNPFAAMDPRFCIDLVDIFPANTTLRTRAGYKQWATGLAGDVRTIMPMNLAAGTRQLLAATNAGVYNITNSIQNPPVAYALTNGDLSYIQFSNVAGAYLLACNGTDNPFLYDGATYTPFSIIAADAPIEEQGPGKVFAADNSLTPAMLQSFHAVSSHQGRIWFSQDNSMTLWYMETDAIGGKLSPFYVGGTLHRGGAILDMGVWSFNAGNGLDDKMFIRTTAGEVAIYAGTDPSDISTWALEATFFLGGPVGLSDSYAEFGGDVLFLSTAGLIPLSQVVQGAANSSLYEQTLTKNISRSLTNIVQSPYFTPNWSVLNIPSLQGLVICIPPTANDDGTQYVMNVLTGAWTRYTLPATCMASYRESLYFGDRAGNVHLFGKVSKNGVLFDGTGGTLVEGRLFSAFNYFDSPANNKHFKLIRPIFQADNVVSFIPQINVDFDLGAVPGTPLPPEGFGVTYLWDSAIWDQARWSQQNSVFRPWTGVTGIGFCAALLMKITCQSVVSMPAIEFVYEEGDSI